LCGSRVFVERSAYKDFVGRFVEQASQLKMGDPLDEKNRPRCNRKQGTTRED